MHPFGEGSQNVRPAPNHPRLSARSSGPPPRGRRDLTPSEPTRIRTARLHAGPGADARSAVCQWAKTTVDGGAPGNCAQALFVAARSNRIATTCWRVSVFLGRNVPSA